jgi:hypothetical protein
LGKTISEKRNTVREGLYEIAHLFAQR